MIPFLPFEAYLLQHNHFFALQIVPKMVKLKLQLLAKQAALLHK